MKMDHQDQNSLRPHGGRAAPGPAGASAPPRRDTATIAVGPEAAPPALWMSILSVALVLFAGLGLYFARSGLVPALDAVFYKVELSASEDGEGTESSTAEEPDVTEVEPLQELNLECSPEEIEADAVIPLLEETEQLITAGRGEIGRFKEMSGEGGKALALRNQWTNWGGTWRNRLHRIRGALPLRSVCVEREDLAPTCDAVDSTMYLLERVPSARRVSEAAELLAKAQEIVDEFRQIQEEEAELARIAAEIETESTPETVTDQPASVPP